MNYANSVKHKWARLADAIAYALDIHAAQMRKGAETPYIGHLEHAAPDILLVSCADKLHNARSICTDLRTHGLAVFDRFKVGQEGTIWYYTVLADAFLRRLPGPLSVELSEAVQQMKQLAGGAWAAS